MGSWREDKDRAKLGWLIRLRWLALLAQITGAYPAMRLGFLPAEFLGLYFSIVTCLTGWNLLSISFLYERKPEITQSDLVIQLLADVGAFTLLLSMTGGIYNPFSALLLLHSALAVLLLRRKAAYLVLGLICLSLGFLQWDPDVSHLSITGSVTRPMISFAYGLVALCIALLLGWLLRTLDELQTKLETMKRQQERLDRLKVSGAIAAGFSHEFATPLYSLKLRMNRIARAANGPILQDAEAAQAALSECERILSTLTRTGLKADQLELEKTAASPLFQEWIQEYKSEFPDSKFAVETAFASRRQIEAPLRPLKRSFYDLLDNAREASSQGEEIRLKLHENPDALRVSIVNRGRELPDVVLEKWGEPFVTTKPDGTGLGLYNAATLVQAMGGNLSIARAEKGATRVEFSIPFLEGEA
jgi:two-component system sensor histidine kinase RegB